jgi:hypothetical protein
MMHPGVANYMISPSPTQPDPLLGLARASAKFLGADATCGNKVIVEFPTTTAGASTNVVLCIVHSVST